jgi:hypothetical protein
VCRVKQAMRRADSRCEGVGVHLTCDARRLTRAARFNLDKSQGG